MDDIKKQQKLIKLLTDNNNTNIKEIINQLNDKFLESFILKYFEQNNSIKDEYFKKFLLLLDKYKIDYLYINLDKNTYYKLILFIINNQTTPQLTQQDIDYLSYYHNAYNCADLLYSMTSEIQSNYDFVSKINDFTGRALKYASPNLQDNIDIVSKAVTLNGRALEYASPNLKKDINVVLKAVKSNGRALQYASPDLQKDKNVVLEAVKSNGRALQYASPDLQTDTDVLSNIRYNRYNDEEIKKKSSLLKYASFNLQDDENFLLQVITTTPYVLEYINFELQDNYNFVLKAIKNNSNVLQYVSPEFKFNKDIVLEAVKKNGLTLQFANPFIRLYNIDIIL
jgi:hypothetical protein